MKLGKAIENKEDKIEETIDALFIAHKKKQKSVVWNGNEISIAELAERAENSFFDTGKFGYARLAVHAYYVLDKYEPIKRIVEAMKGCKIKKPRIDVPPKESIYDREGILKVFKIVKEVYG